MKPNIIDKLKAYQLMKLSNGKVFTATFTKKNGDIRKINGKTRVNKAIRGEGGKGLQYNPLEKLLLPIVDMQEYARLLSEAKAKSLSEDETAKLLRKSWRSINLQTLEHLAINKQEYHVI